MSASESDGEVYVYLPHMTTVEFKNRVSFRTSTDEVAYIDRDGVYHGYAKGISSDPSLSFSPATSGTAGGTLSVSVGDKTSSSVAISPVRCARQPYVSSHNSNGSYPLVFTSDVDAGYKDLYTDTVNSLSYNPNSYTLTCPTFVGDLTGNADTATQATQATQATKDGSGNTITSTYLSDISVDRGSHTFYTYTTSGISSSVEGLSYRTYLTLTKGSTSKSFMDLTGLVASIIAGTGTGTPVGNVRWVCCKTTGKWSKKNENIYMSGTILHPVDMTTSESGTACVIRFNASTSINNTQLSGVWRLLSCVGEISNGHMLVALAVRVY